jgi:hypothetical protein
MLDFAELVKLREGDIQRVRQPKEKEEEKGKPMLGNPEYGAGTLFTDRSLSCFKLKPAARYEEDKEIYCSIYTHPLCIVLDTQLET